MREFYKPKYFKTHELVDKQTYEKFGEKSLMFFDIRILKFIDGLREYFNEPITINNWHVGGRYENRGLRSPNSKVGASYSQHRFGRGVDFEVKGYTAEQVRKTILEHQNEYPFNLITRLEIDISWVHADCAMVDSQSIVTFRP